MNEKEMHMEKNNSSTLKDYVQIMEPALDEILVPRTYLDQIKLVAGAVPAAVTDIFGFECRLGPGEQRSDLAFSIGNTPRQKELFLQATRGHHDYQGPYWQPVIDFVSEWNGKKFHYNSQVWLEFDLLPENLKIAPSGMFFAAGSQINTVFKKSDSTKSWPLLHQDYINPVLAFIKKEQFHPGMQQKILECYQALPDRHAVVFMTGLMLARKTNAVRLSIKELRPGQILDYLQNIGAETSLKEIAELLEDLSHFRHSFILDIDVDSTIGKRIGFELYFKEPAISLPEPPWKDFLEHLVDQGLCQTEKARALLNYSGYELDDGQKHWPSNLRRGAEIVGRSRTSAFVRKLSHFKIDYCQGDISAKAYLEARLYWVKLS